MKQFLISTMWYSKTGNRYFKDSSQKITFEKLAKFSISQQREIIHSQITLIVDKHVIFFFCFLLLGCCQIKIHANIFFHSQ